MVTERCFDGGEGVRLSRSNQTAYITTTVTGTCLVPLIALHICTGTWQQLGCRSYIVPPSGRVAWNYYNNMGSMFISKSSSPLPPMLFHRDLDAVAGMELPASCENIQLQLQCVAEAPLWRVTTTQVDASRGTKRTMRLLGFVALWVDSLLAVAPAAKYGTD